MMLELETAELAKKHDLIGEIVPLDSSCGAESLSCTLGGKALSKKKPLSWRLWRSAPAALA
jgi:hypothetical protein